VAGLDDILAADRAAREQARAWLQAARSRGTPLRQAAGS
jgi:hypothetical protein